MAAEYATVVWARDHLFAGCVSFSLFVFLAWISAVFNDHHLHATLSEMVHDWNTAEGKIFIPALLLPAIFFLLSSYPYKLPTATVRDHKLGHVVVVIRHFFVNAGLVVVAFVPTIGEGQLSSRAHSVEVYIHSAAAALTFLSFALAELFVLVCSNELHLRDGELKWRTWALSFMCACLILLGIHKALYTLHIVGAYSEAWTFRYEMLLGGALVSQNQLLWYFSDPDPSHLKDQGFRWLAAMPYIGCITVIGTDFFSRNNQYALPWLIGECLALLVAWRVCTVAIAKARSWALKGSEDNEAGNGGYGAVERT